MQLIIEFGVGIAVFVRCFVDRGGMENEIAERLGIGFSRPPFATVVVCSDFSPVAQAVHIVVYFEMLNKFVVLF